MLRHPLRVQVRFKLAAVEGDQPDEAVEELLSRQLEEEIKMCKEELGLIPKMAGAHPVVAVCLGSGRVGQCWHGSGCR